MKINSRHSTRTNNIAKVKYHLPTPALHERRNSNSHSQLHSNSNTRKHSVKAHERVDRSAQNVLVDFMKERHDLSFEIMGVSDLSNVRTEKTRIDGKENFSMFP